MENKVQQVISSDKPLLQKQTLIPSPPSTNWPKILLYTFFGLIVISGPFLAGIQIGKGQTASQQSAEIQPNISPTQIAVIPTGLSTTPTITTNTSPKVQDKSFPKLPIVIFESPLSSEDYSAQRIEIQQKIVDPYIQYFQHFGGDNYVVTLSIGQQNSDNLKIQYPYNLHGIMSDGSSHYEALMQSNGKLNWWIPTCMGPCDYSDTFKEKYPQIVSKTNP